MKSQPSIYELITGGGLFCVTFIVLAALKGSGSIISYPILAVNWIGLLLAIDYSVRKVGGNSFLPSRFRFRRFLSAAAVAFLVGFILDFVGMFQTKLWVYPTLTLPVYLLIAPLGYVTYFLILLSLYELAMGLINKNDRAEAPSKFSPLVMKVEGSLGLFLLIAGIIYGVHLSLAQSVDILNISSPEKIAIAWWYPFSVALALFFLFEFTAFRQGKYTLTGRVVNLDVTPIVAILAADIIAILVIEYVNTFLALWRFENWPFDSIGLINIPVVALLAWQLQLPVALSLLNIVQKGNNVF